MKTVIKLGGRVQSDPALVSTLVSALVSLWKPAPGSYCVVHGGGDEVSALQRRMGREPSFVNGRRITTEEDLDVVRMVLSGSANKKLVSVLAAAGLPAVGISGEDGGLLDSEPIDVQQFGRAGKPTAVNVSVVNVLLDNGFLPVISPVARDATSRVGQAMNVNGDDAAAAIAAALNAELWLIADVAGVIGIGGDVLQVVDPALMDDLVEDGTVNRGMHAKLEAGFTALASGASAVRIAGLEALTNLKAGTELSLTPSMK